MGKRDAADRTKHTVVMEDALWVRLKIAAAEDHDDVSAILARLAEQWLKSRKGGGR
jgi:hypothetical protein